MKSPATAADRADRATVASLLWCGLALLVPRATLFGELCPFGIGLAASSAAANLPTLLCLSIGYLLAGPVTEPVRYVATVAMVGGLRWVLAALPEWSRRRFLPPVLAFAACAGTGLLILGEAGAPFYQTLTVLAEGAVAAGAALFFDATAQAAQHPERPLSTGTQTAVILTGAVAVVAAATLEVNGFAPGRVLAAFLVLALARSGRESGGSIAGCVVGGALALAAPGQTPLAVALAFGGLLAGLFSRFGRLMQAGVFLLCAGVVTLSEPDATMLVRLYEIGVACLLFALLPRAWDRRMARLFFKSRDLPAVEGMRRMARMQLQVACGAIEEVARSVEEVSRRLLKNGGTDLAGLYRGCAVTVCGTCPMRGLCWDAHAAEMQEGLEQLTPLLRQEGRITPDSLRGYPAAQCRNKERLTGYLNQGYQQWVAQESAWTRLREIQQAVELQFSGTGELLRGLSDRMGDPQQVDVELSGQVVTLCEDYGLTVLDALCTRDAGNHLTVDILTEDGATPVGTRWFRQVEQLCDRTFAPPIEAVWGNRVRITLAEPPRYRVEWGQAQIGCATEKLCGDSLQVNPMEGGVLAVLADGMGSGGRAAVDSTMAAGITTRLWRAGFSPAAILQTVNAALLVKSREESLSTLDVAVVDTHSGRLDSYKAGAAVTLLRSQGRISRLDRPGLPVGILPQVEFEHNHDLLAEGDVLLMVSDGALCAGVTPLEELLRNFPETGSMQDLAQAVCDAARAAEEHPDDISAIALRLAKEG